MCHLDYCNLFLYGITDDLLQRLQSVRNAAARLVSGTRRRVHITPVLQWLHWLPVRQRVEFNLTLLVYKAIHALHRRTSQRLYSWSQQPDVVISALQTLPR